jgi:hypothetical protein
MISIPGWTPAPTPTGLGQNLITGSNEAKDNIFYIYPVIKKRKVMCSVYNHNRREQGAPKSSRYRVGLGVEKRKSHNIEHIEPVVFRSAVLELPSRYRRFPPPSELA